MSSTRLPRPAQAQVHSRGEHFHENPVSAVWTRVYIYMYIYIYTSFFKVVAIWKGHLPKSKGHLAISNPNCISKHTVSLPCHPRRRFANWPYKDSFQEHCIFFFWMIWLYQNHNDWFNCEAIGFDIPKWAFDIQAVSSKCLDLHFALIYDIWVSDLFDPLWYQNVNRGTLKKLVYNNTYILDVYLYFYARLGNQKLQFAILLLLPGRTWIEQRFFVVMASDW